MFHENTPLWPHWILRHTVNNDDAVLFNKPFDDLLDKRLLLDHLCFCLDFLFNLFQLPGTQVLLLDLHSFGFLTC